MNRVEFFLGALAASGGQIVVVHEHEARFISE